MVRFRLDEDLDTIAGGANFAEIVRNLLRWAEEQGRTQELVEKAYAFNPGNPLLKAVWQELSTGVFATATGQETVNRPDAAPTKRIRILFLASNPEETGHIHLDREHREIQARIRASEYRDQIELVSEWAVRPLDVMEALLRNQPDIVHFSSHGTQQEELLLEDDRGIATPVSKQALHSLFGALKDNIKLVFLNACYSEPQAEAIIQHIPCAIGMSNAIGTEEAIKFAEFFYLAIGFGRTIQTAFELGKVALPLSNLPEEALPQLKVKSGEDDDRPLLAPGKCRRIESICRRCVMKPAREEIKPPPIEETDVFRTYVALADRLWNIVGWWTPTATETVGKPLICAADRIGACLVSGDRCIMESDTLHPYQSARLAARETRYWLQRASSRQLLTAREADELLQTLTEATRQLNMLIHTCRCEKNGSLLREMPAGYLTGEADPFSMEP
jgi:four helix bundle protein